MPSDPSAWVEQAVELLEELELAECYFNEFGGVEVPWELKQRARDLLELHRREVILGVAS